MLYLNDIDEAGVEGLRKSMRLVIVGRQVGRRVCSGLPAVMLLVGGAVAHAVIENLRVRCITRVTVLRAGGADARAVPPKWLRVTVRK